MKYYGTLPDCSLREVKVLPFQIIKSPGIQKVTLIKITFPPMNKFDCIRLGY